MALYKTNSFWQFQFLPTDSPISPFEAFETLDYLKCARQIRHIEPGSICYMEPKIR